MLKKINFLYLFLGLSVISMAQVSFYGDPVLVDSLNTDISEGYIYLDNGGQDIYFSREKYSGNVGGKADRGDIWRSQLSGDNWSKPENLPINDAGFCSPIGFTPNKTFFLYNKVRFEKGIYIGEVWASNTDFTQSQQVDIPSLKNLSPVQTGTLSFDGKYLLLSIESNIGYGVEDLYVCRLEDDGAWSSPKNLGYNINTPFQEITPFLAADNKTLFFATNARNSKGSFDIYTATRLDDTWRNWSTPQNIDEVNTIGAESSFCFAPGGEFAYYISTQNSDGYGDIKRIKIRADIEEAEKDTANQMILVKKQVPSVNIRVRNAKTGESISASGLAVNLGGDSLRVVSNEEYIIRLESENPELLRIELKSAGYLSDYLVVQPEDYEIGNDSVIAVDLEPLETGNTITIKNVLFHRGTANFVEGSEGELDLIAEMMDENPKIKILLKGHTDNQGDPDLNLKLSEERVQSVKTYLVDAGIESERINGKGYGGSEPIASNAYEDTRRLNRRVEFEIIEN